jgi:Bifunctional DNA primase/polymerase, N-terminal
MTPLARAALRPHLAWPVFPIKPNAKAPPLIEAWPERATADPDIIAGWWAVWPNANSACTAPICSCSMSTTANMAELRSIV